MHCSGGRTWLTQAPWRCRPLADLHQTTAHCMQPTLMIIILTRQQHCRGHPQHSRHMRLPVRALLLVRGGLPVRGLFVRGLPAKGLLVRGLLARGLKSQRPPRQRSMHRTQTGTPQHPGRHGSRSCCAAPRRGRGCPRGEARVSVLASPEHRHSHECHASWAARIRSREPELLQARVRGRGLEV